MNSAVDFKKPVFKVVSDSNESLQVLLEEDQVAKKLMRDLCEFVDSQNEEYLNVEPWLIFNAWLDHTPEKEAPNLSVFRAWQMFHWTPHPRTVSFSSMTSSTPSTIASAYAALNQERLTPNEIYVLNAAQKKQLDIYEVVGLNGQYLILYGLIARKKVCVYHEELSRVGRIGEYILASVVPIDQMRSIFLGTSRFISCKAAPQVKEFCRFLDRCENTTREFKSFESDVFNLFYDLNKNFI